jgi:hypothetical protein
VHVLVPDVAVPFESVPTAINRGEKMFGWGIREQVKAGHWKVEFTLLAKISA